MEFGVGEPAFGGALDDFRADRNLGQQMNDDVGNPDASTRSQQGGRPAATKQPGLGHDDAAESNCDGSEQGHNKSVTAGPLVLNLGQYEGCA